MLRNRVNLLPEEIKAELDRRLVAGSFSGYAGLESWLEQKCLENNIDESPSKWSIYRYSTRLKKHIDAIKLATDEANAIAEAAGDDAQMARALTVLAQQKIYNVLLDYQPDPDSFDLLKGAKAIAELNRSDVQVGKYRTEMKEKIAAKFEELQKPDRNLDQKTLQVIREQIYGLM